jgi:outer membrane protein
MQFISSKQTALFRMVLFVLFTPLLSLAQQTNPSDSVLDSAPLARVIEYALVHQPAVQQAMLDDKITRQAIKGKLADWYPQITFNYNYQHFIDRQTIVINEQPIKTGVTNTSYVQFIATQNIFNRDVVLASSTVSKVKLQAEQNISRSKIDVVVNVTKAFYDVLATSQQIKVNEESIVRLQRSLKDALSRYNSGVADKTDYKRATILLGNAQASLKTSQELLKYKHEYLKTLMGYPTSSDLPIQYDTLQMENEIVIDTIGTINYSANIEYQILNTQKELQEANLKYSKWAFIPSLTAVGNYNLNYQNNAFRELFDKRFPYSYVGVTLSVPIFQGGKRMAKIREQKFASERLDISTNNLEHNLSTEYTRALALYKSNLENYQIQKENAVFAKEVYDIIQLQYRNGVRSYLDVTVAESDLRTTRINYFNALYSVLASKMDVLRVRGEINY